MGFLVPLHMVYAGSVDRATLKSGETLLIIGGSGRIRPAAIQLGRALGATVVATARWERAGFYHSQGAEYVFDPDNRGIAEAILEITGGRGVSVICDTVGSDVYNDAGNGIPFGGRVVLIGFSSGKWGTLEPAHTLWQDYSESGGLHVVRTHAQRKKPILTCPRN
jgi:NADPH:quinone reductase